MSGTPNIELLDYVNQSVRSHASQVTCKSGHMQVAKVNAACKLTFATDSSKAQNFGVSNLQRPIDPNLSFI